MEAAVHQTVGADKYYQQKTEQLGLFWWDNPFPAANLCNNQGANCCDDDGLLYKREESYGASRIVLIPFNKVTREHNHQRVLYL
jgi:hypothetical protein